MTTTQDAPTEIVEAPLVSPADPKRVLEVVRRFEEFKKEVLKPTDYVLLETGKEKRPYIKKSGWMKYALACQLSLEKRDERVEDLSDGGKIYHYTYRAISPNGRYADAVGSASSKERKFTHPDHDVRVLAQTRACNRAISNLVAGGEVSAEEMLVEAGSIEPLVTGQPESEAGTTHITNVPQPTPEIPTKRDPQGVWSPTLANLVNQSEQSIEKDKEILAQMSIREFDDGHQEFLIEPKYGYITNTGPMRFLHNRILEKQKIRATEKKTTIPFQYEIHENNNGILSDIWISCEKLDSKDVELNLINPLIWTFDAILHLDSKKQAAANRRLV